MLLDIHEIYLEVLGRYAVHEGLRGLGPSHFGTNFWTAPLNWAT